MPDEPENQSFWDFLMPQAQAGVDNARAALNDGDTEFADVLLNAASDQLDAAKDQTQRQIADRDSGTYDPDAYYENGAECSIYNPRHPNYEPDDYDPAAARRRARQAIEDMED